MNAPDPAAFATVADEYELGRPEYPAGVLDLLGLSEADRVLDLAAGTGKLTRLLTRSGARVVAVEPLAELRERIGTAAEVLDGTAEAIPLPDHSVDVVTVGDAWHWFGGERAAGEVARVIRAHGSLVLLWQVPEVDDAPWWFARLGELLATRRGDHPGFRGRQGREAIERHPRFDGPREARVPFTWHPTPQEVVAYAASASFVAGLEPAERAALLDEVSALLPPEPLTVPYATTVWSSTVI